MYLVFLSSAFGHRPRVTVAGRPAADLGTLGHLVVGEHDRRLDVIFLVGGVDAPAGALKVSRT
ncbi:MAG: hypothetical protein V5B30_05610 [Candidatus Accumulibacter delftensis]